MMVLEIVNDLLRLDNSNTFKLLLRFDHSQCLLVHIIEQRVLS